MFVFPNVACRAYSDIPLTLGFGPSGTVRVKVKWDITGVLKAPQKNTQKSFTHCLNSKQDKQPLKINLVWMPFKSESVICSPGKDIIYVTQSN